MVHLQNSDKSHDHAENNYEGMRKAAAILAHVELAINLLPPQLCYTVQCSRPL